MKYALLKCFLVLVLVTETTLLACMLKVGPPMYKSAIALQYWMVEQGLQTSSYDKSK